MSSNIVTLTVENFKDVIVDGSHQKLVAAYFWAPFDEASTQVKGIVETVAAKHESVLTLATVDCEAQQQIAGQFGIRGLPTLMLVKEGQPVDGAAGPMTQEQVEELFAKHLPKPEDELMRQAAESIAQDDYQQAYPLAKQAFDLAPDNIDAKYLLADCAITLGQVDSGKELLSTITMVDQDARYQTLLGKIELAEKAAESPEILELQEKLANEPDNDEVKLQLAVQLQQANKTADALELLYSILVKDMNFKDAKKLTLDTINALPDGEPLKSQYRRKIYSLLY